MSRCFVTAISRFGFIKVNNKKPFITLSRFLSNATTLASNATHVTPVTFKDGFLRFKVDRQQFVMSFWTPVTQVAEVIRPAISSSQISAPGQEVDLNVLTAQTATVKVLDMNNEEVITSATEPTALGTVLSDSGSIQVSTGSPNVPIELKLDGMVDDLKKWMMHNAPPKPFEAQVRNSNLKDSEHDLVLKRIHNLSSNVCTNFCLQPSYLHVLQKEKEAIVSTYQPMEDEFMHLLVDSESQAQSRFKWGGLFLLSAQLGFVGRLTWFEYSWDIMEPITWCLTYCMMLGTFSYYIFTTQEFMLPLVEKRAVQERFWRNVRKSHFDVNQFKQLRTQLLSVQRKAKKARHLF